MSSCSASGAERLLTLASVISGGSPGEQHTAGRTRNIRRHQRQELLRGLLTETECESAHAAAPDKGGVLRAPRERDPYAACTAKRSSENIDPLDIAPAPGVAHERQPAPSRGEMSTMLIRAQTLWLHECNAIRWPDSL